MENYKHTPVLLAEVIGLLDPKSGENFVDATLGGGGYTQAILEKVSPSGSVLAIDLDPKALENFETQIRKTKFAKQAVVVHGNFRDVDKILKRHNFPVPNGIVADLGLSSFELDESGRGMSFEKKEVLDMRFDPTGEDITAEFILNNYDLDRLINIFRSFGEEKFAAQVARKIQETRTKNQIKIQYTTQLLQIIESALPKPVKHKAKDSARRIFQALRIEVNHELDNLQQFLEKAFDVLSPGGRMAVVSFHSLEDRMVKQYFQDLSKGCVCPPDFPQCVCGRNPKAKILTKKPVMAGEQEIKINSRSKPAKLRAILKI